MFDTLRLLSTTTILIVGTFTPLQPSAPGVAGAYAPELNFVDEPTPVQRETISWAVGRFIAADLALPDLDIRFPVFCNGKGALYHVGQSSIDFCRVNRKNVLHEFAHAWDDTSGDVDRDGFLELRGLDLWFGGLDVPYEEQGSEHLATVIAWGLMEPGTRSAHGLPHNSDAELNEAFEFLTDSTPDQPVDEAIRLRVSYEPSVVIDGGTPERRNTDWHPTPLSGGETIVEHASPLPDEGPDRAVAGAVDGGSIRFRCRLVHVRYRRGQATHTTRTAVGGPARCSPRSTFTASTLEVSDGESVTHPGCAWPLTRVSDDRRMLDDFRLISATTIVVVGMLIANQPTASVVGAIGAADVDSEPADSTPSHASIRPAWAATVVTVDLLAASAARDAAANEVESAISRFERFAAGRPHILEGDVADVIVRIRGAICSGIPITGTRFVVTAAHCVLSRKGEVTTRAVERDGVSYAVEAVLVDTDYHHNPSPQLDAAVLVLAEEIPGPSARLGSTLPTTGEVTVAGLQPIEGDGTLLRGNSPYDRPLAKDANGNPIKVEYLTAGCVEAVHALEVTSARLTVHCGLIPGASGGGLFVANGGELVLVGILSTVTSSMTANGVVPLASLHELLAHPDVYTHVFQV